MRTVVILIFVVAGMALAWWNFRKFPWKSPPTRTAWLLNLIVYLLIGGGIGFLAGGWLAGRLP